MSYEKINMIEILEHLGFEKYYTGGGCMAMFKELDESGKHILITDHDAGIDTLENMDPGSKQTFHKLNRVKPENGIMIGFYNADAECYFCLSDVNGLGLVDAELITQKKETE
jgi:hypothetical protein